MPVITLFPYQRDAVDKVMTAYASGMRRPALSLPTGAGKSVIFSQVIKECGQRALIIGHRKKIVEQNAATPKMVIDDASTGIVMGEKDEPDADIVSASVQTILNPKRLERLGDFGLIVADEAHHFASDSFLAVLARLGAGPDGNVRLLGVSATWDRHDGLGLDGVFDDIVYQVRIEQLIAAGYLSDIRAYTVQVQEDLSHVRTGAGGDFDQDELADQIVAGGEYPQAIARSLMEHGRGRHSLVFAPRIDVATAYRDAIRGTGMTAELVHGGTPKPLRERIIADLRHGNLDAICNVGVFTEGVDVPAIDLIAMGRPTKSRALFQQMIGRGIRTHPGKRDCIILDLSNNIDTHEIQTISSLFGTKEEGESLKESIERNPDRVYVPSVLNPSAVRIAARATKLLGFDASKLAWSEVEQDTYSISAGDIQYLAIPGKKNADLYDVVSYSRERGREIVVRDMDIGYSKGIVEQLVLDSSFATMMKRSASWRQRDEPMTEAQGRAFRYYRLPIIEGTTKADASSMIDMAKAKRNLTDWKRTLKQESQHGR